MVVSNSSTDVKEWSTGVKQIFCRLAQIHELSNCGLPNHCVSGSDVVPFLPNFEQVKRNNQIMSYCVKEKGCLLMLR